MNKINTRSITCAAALVAIEIALSRFCSISTPIVKIGFGFLPIALCGMLLGPYWAAGAAATADIIGALLFPIGAYFPGFTLTAALAGYTYGLALHKSDAGLMRVIAAVVFINVVLNLGLDTVWITMTTGKAVYAILGARVIKVAIMAPIQIILIRLLQARVLPQALRITSA